MSYVLKMNLRSIIILNTEDKLIQKRFGLANEIGSMQFRDCFYAGNFLQRSGEAVIQMVTKMHFSCTMIVFSLSFAPTSSILNAKADS